MIVSQPAHKIHAFSQLGIISRLQHRQMGMVLLGLRLHRRKIADSQAYLSQHAMQRLLQFMQSRGTGAAIDFDEDQRLSFAVFT